MAVDQLSTTFAALADPTRREILARLAEGEATVNELAEPFPVTVQAVSKHLKVLERAGLVERARSAQRRPSRLRGEALKEAADWLTNYRPSGRAASTASTSVCARSRRGPRVGEGADAREVAITRVFDAPRELVWKEWTEPERLAAWWGKRGWSTPPEGSIVIG